MTDLTPLADDRVSPDCIRLGCGHTAQQHRRDDGDQADQRSQHRAEVERLTAQLAAARRTIAAQAEQLRATGTLLCRLRDLDEQRDRAWAAHDTTAPAENAADGPGEVNGHPDEGGATVDALGRAEGAAGPGSAPDHAHDDPTDAERAATVAQIARERAQLDDDLAAGRIADHLGGPAPAAAQPAGYEIAAHALHRDGLGALRTGDLVASVVSTRPTLADAVDELRHAIDAAQEG